MKKLRGSLIPLSKPLERTRSAPRKLLQMPLGTSPLLLSFNFGDTFALGVLARAAMAPIRKTGGCKFFSGKLRTMFSFTTLRAGVISRGTNQARQLDQAPTFNCYAQINCSATLARGVPPPLLGWQTLLAIWLTPESAKDLLVYCRDRWELLSTLRQSINCSGGEQAGNQVGKEFSPFFG